MERDWLALYLEEDLGSGDLSAAAVGQASGTARMVFRQAGLLAGIEHAVRLFGLCGANATRQVPDGSMVEAGQTVLTVTGPAAAILAAERTALNLVGRMSGIATKTRELAAVLANDCSGAVVAGTRKTTPGFRAFEKQAITIGGGTPHRMGLWDEAMVKDNHREAAGGIAKAVTAVLEAHPGVVVTAEAESLDDCMAAAEAGAQWVMIDNQSPDTGKAWATALWQKHPNLKVEASGGITPDTLRDFAWADRISLGWLTHQATSLDVGLDWGAA